MLTDNGGSTINNDGKRPGGFYGLGGWGRRAYVCMVGSGGLAGVEDSACVTAALNYSCNHQSACQQNRTRGLDINPTCTELAQHFNSKALQLTHMCIHALPSRDAPSERD